MESGDLSGGCGFRSVNKLRRLRSKEAPYILTGCVNNFLELL